MRDETVATFLEERLRTQPLRRDRRVPSVRRRRRPAGAAAHGRAREAVQPRAARAFGRRRDRAPVPAGSRTRASCGRTPASTVPTPCATCCASTRTCGATSRFAASTAAAARCPPNGARSFTEFPDRFMVGTDTFTPERWHYIVEHASWSRAWLADLPPALAERIAWRNGEALFSFWKPPRRRNDRSLTPALSPHAGRRCPTGRVRGASCCACLAVLARRRAAAQPAARRSPAPGARSRTGATSSPTRPLPDPIAVGQHFVVDFAVCPRGGAAAPQAVRVDANMPEHRHGMNYRPASRPRRRPLSRRRPAVPHARPLGPDVRRGDAAAATERLAEHAAPRMRSRTPHCCRLRSSSPVALAAAAARLVAVHATPRCSASSRTVRGRRRARPIPSNRVSGNATAIAFGERLFGDASLSRHGHRRVRTCHRPDARVHRRPAARGRACARRSQHAEPRQRRRPALVRLGRRARQPVGAEPAADARSAGNGQRPRARRGARARRSGRCAPRYVAAFGRAPPAGRRDRGRRRRQGARGLRRDARDRRARRSTTSAMRSRAAIAPPRRAIRSLAQRGLAIFVGSGNCTACHGGPRFTQRRVPRRRRPVLRRAGPRRPRPPRRHPQARRRAATTCSARTTTTRRAPPRSARAT